MPAGSEERDAAYEEAPLLASWPGAADPPPPPPLPSAAAAAAAKQGSVAGPRTVELSARSEACVQAGGPACDSLQPASSARRSVDGSAAGGLHPAGVPWGGKRHFPSHSLISCCCCCCCCCRWRCGGTVHCHRRAALLHRLHLCCSARAFASPPCASPLRRCVIHAVTAALLLADMFGIGALALPSVFARLGWLVGADLSVLLRTGCTGNLGCEMGGASLPPRSLQVACCR